jgi:predicted outer membrane repeat protein
MENENMKLLAPTIVAATYRRGISTLCALAAVAGLLISVTVHSQTVMEWMKLRARSDNLGQSPANLAQPLQTFIVTNTNDSGPGSLRQAILDANASQGHDAIVFQTNNQESIANQTVEGIANIRDQTLVATSNNTITLTSGYLHIMESVTINGLGADALTISGNNSSQVFRVFRFNNDGSPFQVEINNLTISDGFAGLSSNCGGGVDGSGTTLNLNDVVVTQNASSLSGGGICFIAGDPNISDSVIAENTAAGSGGAIHTGPGQEQ